MLKISLTEELKNADHYTSNLPKGTPTRKPLYFLQKTPVQIHKLVYMATEFMKN